MIFSKKVVEYLHNLWYSNYRVQKRKGVITMFQAYDFATWFIWKNFIEQKENEIDKECYEVYEGISHLKVQKLLYYAQGISLAVRNQPLFEENIIAWPHGPIVREVYDLLKNNKRNDIPEKVANKNIDNIMEISSNSELLNILELTYDNFGGYTAWQLREKTHELGSPWEVVVDTTGLGSIIPNDMIKEYFLQNIIDND